MENKLENIEFSESFILGWERTENNLILYLEVLLSELHDDFEPFDEDIEYGCYKLGIMKFYDVTDVDGLSSDSSVPKRSEKTGEYIDLYEIDSFSIEDSTFRIESDELSISFKFNKFDFKIGYNVLDKQSR